ncbi:type II toxin-antitoxin system VapB family antitoxin [Nocardioides sp. B-3]|uniref:type II toxin-antitoxin system VapB family antitoxin n=1 Tax=Nocardioides sp. B-3 TaxID=2895565 RepID=UPI0021525AF6|nr:type II toxin-antitoxin system VapB family antitoxin [Nocardioides sp. B-3]UUZ60127.1 type II toxin-antitoxin system VapB family antitoxin [Nocardioides sp. B-3]
MAINIKNERVLTLARRAAEVTGKSRVSAIEEAPEQFLEQHADRHRVDIARREEQIRAVLRDADAAPVDPERAIKTREDLYDPTTGLPGDPGRVLSGRHPGQRART